MKGANMLKRLFTVLIILLFANTCFAGVVGNSSDIKVPYGPGISKMKASGMGPFKLSFDAEALIDKNLTEEDTTRSKHELDGQWYMFRLGYVFADRVEPYIKFGDSHVTASWTENSNDVKLKGDHGLVFGAGVRMLAFEMPEYRLKFTLDTQYRHTEPEADSITVGVPGRFVSTSEFEVTEWQVGGIVSMEFPLKYDRKDPAAIYSIIPYTGIAYSDGNVKAEFPYNGFTYKLSNAKNKDKLLLIAGCDITSPENISLNAEARLIGETSASGGCTLKF